jgi:RNA polymerase sigma factor (sigma-70 family)
MENQDLQYIQAILKNDSVLLDKLYRKFLPALFGMLRRNGGSFEDAKDVFQESLVVIFHHAAYPEFQLTAPFQAYLLGIGRFIWLRQLKKNARIKVTSEWEDGSDVDADIEQQIFASEKRMLFREKFNQLGQDCQQLLQRFFDRERLNHIAEDMGYTADYVKKKNKVCKEKLMDLIQKDARFVEISAKVSPSKIQANPNGI